MSIDRNDYLDLTSKSDITVLFLNEIICNIVEIKSFELFNFIIKNILEFNFKID
jgi:hypothetical protein